MNPDLLIAASLFAGVSSVTPGPNNTMILASGVNFGVHRSMPHLLGISLGFGVMLMAVGLGLHTVLERFPAIYTTMRYGGTAYLLWLAWKLVRSGPLQDNAERPSQPMSFMAAAAFQWINPKAWVMAVTAMTTYLPANALVSQVALLAGLFVLINIPCVGLWAAFGSALRNVLQDPQRLRIFNTCMALALVASLYPMLFSG
jgi:threonine/homoserine/homoserine lactone efflux protein